MKVAVLTDLYLYEWASDALERVEKETDHTIELVVVNAVDQGRVDNVDMSNNPRLSLAAIRTFVSKLREQGP